MSNIQKLIAEVEILNYLEEFDAPTYKTQGASNLIKLLLAGFPIINNFNMYQCIKRTTMTLGQKIYFFVFATFPFIGSMLLMICMLRSNLETLAAANLIPFITKFGVFLHKLVSTYSKENKVKLQEIHDSYFLQFKQLKKKYPIVNDENQLDIAKEYGQLAINYYNEVIIKIEELYSDQLSKDDLDDFKEFKSEFAKIKTDFKNKDWSKKPLSQLGV